VTDNEIREPSKPKRASTAVAVILVVAALFGGVLLAKALNRTPTPQVASPSGASTGAPAQSGAPTVTSTHNDAVADYEAALKTSKPIYVLFHSLS